MDSRRDSRRNRPSRLRKERSPQSKNKTLEAEQTTKKDEEENKTPHLDKEIFSVDSPVKPTEERLINLRCFDSEAILVQDLLVQASEDVVDLYLEDLDAMA